MKITLNTQDIIEKYNAIEEFIKKDVNIPIQFAWDLEDNQEKFKSIVERFERHRNDLLKPLQDKGALENTEDGHISVKNEYIDEFNTFIEKVNELLMTENEIEIKTIKKSDIPDMISLKDLRAIKFMVED